MQNYANHVVKAGCSTFKYDKWVEALSQVQHSCFYSCNNNHNYVVIVFKIMTTTTLHITTMITNTIMTMITITVALRTGKGCAR